MTSDIMNPILNRLIKKSTIPQSMQNTDKIGCYNSKFSVDGSLVEEEYGCMSGDGMFLLFNWAATPRRSTSPDFLPPCRCHRNDSLKTGRRDDSSCRMPGG